MDANPSLIVPRALFSVSAKALRHNAKAMRARMPAQKLLAVVKANAYGCGIAPVYHALRHEVDAFGVSYFFEAEQLRQLGCKQRILVLTGFYSSAELQAFSGAELDAVLSQAEHVTLLEEAVLPAPIRVWLKIDTGMHRLGVYLSEAAALITRLQACANVAELTLMTHLAGTDYADQAGNLAQIECFMALAQQYDLPTSVANSAGMLCLANTLVETTWVRPGLALYGVSPFFGHEANDFGLLPVSTLTARLLSVKTVPMGAYVGYGREWQAGCETHVGVVALGYADDYPRSGFGQGVVLVQGQRCPIIGNISMDMMAVDVTGVKVAVGDEVTLWGPGLPVEVVAANAGISVYELLARVSARRVQRGHAIPIAFQGATFGAEK